MNSARHHSNKTRRRKRHTMLTKAMIQRLQELKILLVSRRGWVIMRPKSCRQKKTAARVSSGCATSKSFTH
eukprot:5468458-Amphidinium_carterae.1